MLQREVTLVFGQTGSGKTYWANEFIRKHPRVLIADAGFAEFDVVECESYPRLVDFLEDRKAFGSHRPFRASYDFRPDEYGLAFDTALRLRDCLLVLEEGDRFSQEHGDDYLGKTDPSYQEAVYRGRHFGLSLLFISLHPRSLPTEVRRQATRIVSFRQIFPDDIDWLSEIMGPEAEKLITLPGPPAKPPHPYLLWTAQTGAHIVSPDANRA